MQVYSEKYEYKYKLSCSLARLAMAGHLAVAEINVSAKPIVSNLCQISGPVNGWCGSMSSTICQLAKLNIHSYMMMYLYYSITVTK
jgi:hypothetical protein